jgi:hypothetical protein
MISRWPMTVTSPVVGGEIVVTEDEWTEDMVVKHVEKSMVQCGVNAENSGCSQFFLSLMRTVTNPRCPCCDRQFETQTSVLKHMNHPLSPCANWFLTRQPLPVQPTPTAPQDAVFESTRSESPASIDIPNPFVNREVRDRFPGAGSTFGQGQSYMDLFNSDTYADLRQESLYYPFTSKGEWEIASFLERCGLSMRWIDEFLNLSLVSVDPIHFNISIHSRSTSIDS